MKPFAGIRVLDLTHVIAGPFSTYQLAVLGADVIKIEPPDRPDMLRAEGVVKADNQAGLGSQFIGHNANKRAMTLDLKSQAGRDILLHMVPGVDVLVENYRTGALADLGLGGEALCELNPRLIYCSLTGYGQSGARSGFTAYDNVIQAWSGMMDATGFADQPPVRVGPPVLDYGTGAQAALAISAALFQRERTGVGQRIDIAMADSALMLMGTSVVIKCLTGSVPVRSGNSSESQPGYSCFETADGQLMVGAYTGEQHRRLWQALDHPDTAGEVAGLTGDGFVDRRDRDHQKLQDILMTRTASEWEDMLNAAGVPAARVRSADESVDNALATGRPVIQQVPCASTSNRTLNLPVAAYSFAHDGPSIERGPPLFGQHTDEILVELGYSSGQIDAFRDQRVI